MECILEKYKTNDAGTNGEIGYEISLMIAFASFKINRLIPEYVNVIHFIKRVEFWCFNCFFVNTDLVLSF